MIFLVPAKEVHKASKHLNAIPAKEWAFVGYINKIDEDDLLFVRLVLKENRHVTSDNLKKALGIIDRILE